MSRTDIEDEPQRSTGTAVLAELSPAGAGVVAIAGAAVLFALDNSFINVVGGLVLWLLAFFAFCGCGLGWMYTGRVRIGVILFVVRFLSVPITGIVLLGLLLSGIDCDSRCGASGGAIALASLLFGATLLLPLASALVLGVVLWRERAAHRDEDAAVGMQW